MKEKEKVVRPGGLELPTFWFVARRSIQLSYGRTVHYLPSAVYSSLFFDFNLACFHIRNLRDIFCAQNTAPSYRQRRLRAASNGGGPAGEARAIERCGGRGPGPEGEQGTSANRSPEHGRFN